MNRKKFIEQYFDLCAAAIITIVCLLIYANNYAVPWYFDDYQNITGNRSVFTLSNPLHTLLTPRGPAILSFAINYALHGDLLFGYHLINNLIHVAASIVVYALLKRVTSGEKWWALAGALVFAAHPLQTQAVTYIVQRMTSLSALCAFSCIYCFVRARDVLADDHRILTLRHASWYVAMILFCALAVATKQNTAFLPFGLYLFGRYFLDKEQNWRRKESALYLSPFIIPPFVIAYTVLIAPLMRGVPLHQIAAAGKISPLHYFVTEWKVMWIYLRLLILPIGQTLDYNYPIVQQLISLQTVAAGGGILTLLATAFLLKERAQNVSFAICWFFAALAVESSFIPLDAVFEHRLYIPMFGFSVVIISAFRCLPWPTPRRCAVISLLVCYCLLTLQRNALWADPVAFSEDNLKKAPGNVRAYIELSRHYIEKQRYGEAEKLLLTAMGIHPNYGKIFDNLGTLYDMQGDKARAIEIYKRGIYVDPGYQKLYLNLAVVYESQMEFGVAESLLKQALKIHPGMATAHYNLGVVLYRMGRLNEALESFRTAVDNAPRDVDALYNLGLTAFETGNMKLARDSVNRLRSISPLRANALEMEFSAAQR